MTSEEALTAVRKNVENENLIKPMLATVEIMIALAERFGEDKEEGGLIPDVFAFAAFPFARTTIKGL